MTYMAKLPQLIKEAIKTANHGCGLSDVLYTSKLQSELSAILEDAPDSERPQVAEALVKNGYDPEFKPFEPEEGQCGTTGIDIDCCPCGRHP